MVADPKALQWITAGYNFPKQPERRLKSLLVTGRGASWAEGMSKSHPLACNAL